MKKSTKVELTVLIEKLDLQAQLIDLVENLARESGIDEATKARLHKRYMYLLREFNRLHTNELVLAHQKAVEGK